MRIDRDLGGRGNIEDQSIRRISVAWSHRRHLRLIETVDVGDADANGDLITLETCMRRTRK